MNKSESYKIVKRIFEKHAGTTSDALGTLGTAMLGRMFQGGAAIGRSPDDSDLRAMQLAIGAPFALGGLHGLLEETPSIEKIHELDSDPGTAVIPGVGFSRILRRRRAIRKQLRDKPGSFGIDLPVSELTGIPSSGVAGALLGTALTGNENVGVGIGLGGQALGALLAGLTPRRTLEEQARVENSKIRPWLRHIIPGLAAYDSLKALGASNHLSGDIDTVKEEIARIRENRRREQEENESMHI